MQSAPAFTGWSGLPSSFTTRPSRFRASTPQPAAHSRHTVANHDATPGTSCSFGTTSGRMCSPAPWQPAVAAAAPVAPTILKKSRRFIAAAARSVVARDAVERRLLVLARVLLAVTVDAPAHRQRRRRGAEAREVQQIVREARPRRGRERRHLLDFPVAGLALHAGADVGLVREVGELRQLVHPHPRDRLLPGEVLGELLDLRQLRARDLVAAHAALDRRQPGVLRAPRVAVAVLAVDLE